MARAAVTALQHQLARQAGPGAAGVLLVGCERGTVSSRPGRARRELTDYARRRGRVDAAARRRFVTGESDSALPPVGPGPAT